MPGSGKKRGVGCGALCGSVGAFEWKGGKTTRGERGRLWEAVKPSEKPKRPPKKFFKNLKKGIDKGATLVVCSQ